MLSGYPASSFIMRLATCCMSLLKGCAIDVVRAVGPIVSCLQPQTLLLTEGHPCLSEQPANKNATETREYPDGMNLHWKLKYTWRIEECMKNKKPGEPQNVV